jgi:SAM-dependent methyltransferase
MRRHSRPRNSNRVLTTLVLHHLDSETKRRALKEAFRVLRPGAELHIADWGRPHKALMRATSTLVRAFDGYGVTRDNLEGRIPELCRDAGFIDVAEPRRRATFFGTLSFYRARKSES